MSKKLRIKVRKPWIGYPGSVMQNNYGEDEKHGFFLWDIQDRKNFDVKFHELPNPKPFVTIEWNGDLNEVSTIASRYPKGSRFRIKSSLNLIQKDVQAIIFTLKQKCDATEVTFKDDTQVQRDVIVSGTSVYEHADLRSAEVLSKLLQEHMSLNGGELSDDDMILVKKQLESYTQLTFNNDEVVRNTKWSIKSMQFDNMFNYGEKNVINFEKLNGIIGIFGQNRVGKSSIVGTILYSLFNTSDRGSVKNLHVINERKQFCYSKVLLNVGNVDYVIERQTTKNENKRGVVNAPTSLNVFRIENDEAIDLCGEQRNDTEKVVKNIIGNVDDFILTSVATQGELNQFIKNGSTKRSQILSKFLDLDIFSRLYDQSNKDANVMKAQLRNFPERDWKKEIDSRESRLHEILNRLVENTQHTSERQSELNELRANLQRFAGVVPVTQGEVSSQEQKVKTIRQNIESHKTNLGVLQGEINAAQEKIKTVENLRTDYDITDLKKRQTAYKQLESTVSTLRHLHEKELTLLKTQKKSLQILDEVPCGDSFPGCKFIKDAHVNKLSIGDQTEKTKKASENLQETQNSLDILKQENIDDKVQKVEKLHVLHTKLSVDVSKKHVEVIKIQTLIDSLEKSFRSEDKKLNDFRVALEKSDNAEVVSIREKIENHLSQLKTLDDEKFSLAKEQGRTSSDIEKFIEEKRQRDIILRELSVYELISRAFSKKGIPNSIIKTQLPIINAEIAKILNGIVDFTIELENDETSDAMEIYINYGDNKRLIELASGMEKTMCSLAVRTALINVSSLPKTDMLILDESFDALDANGIDACNQLLVSLKKYFRTILVISHLDGIKENVDDVIEINKIEKDSKIVFS